MKKPVIALIVLVLLAGGSCGAFLAVKNKNDAETKKQQEIIDENHLFSFNSDDIKTIVFQCADGTYSTTHSEKNWTLDGGEFLLDQDYMQNICTYISELTAEKNYGEATSENKSMYGLESPDSITLSDGNSEYKLYVGSISPTSDYYYVMKDGVNSVYTVPSLEGSVLKTSRMMLKSKDLIPYGDNEISEITVKRDGKTAFELSFDTEKRQWSLPDEYSNLTFDQTAVSAMTTTLTRLEAEEMLEENLENLSKYGFDKPVAEVTVKGTDGTEKTFLVSDHKSDSTSYSYVLLKDSNQVETYYTSDLSFINYNPIDFLLTSVPVSSIYNITSFDFILGEDSNSFEISMADSKLSCNGEEIDFTDVEISTMFQNFFTALSTVTITDVDVSAEPVLQNPLLSAVFNNEDGSSDSLDLVKCDDENCYVFVNGKYTGAVASQEKLSGKNSVKEFYDNFCEKTGISSHEVTRISQKSEETDENTEIPETTEE